MQVIINDRTITFPTTLAEFTLGQRIDFQEQYGNELDAMAKSIVKMPEGFDKDLEIAQFMIEKCFRTFGFFAGVDPEVLKESDFVDDIAGIYYANMQTLMEDEASVELNLSYEWKGELWEIHPPELKHGSKMTFGEFVDSKQLVKDLHELGKNKWEHLLPLTAIYFRRKDEAYDESFLYEDSDRLKLMRDLPMDIALAVGFFLNSSLHFSLNHLMYSDLAVGSQGNLRQNTLTGTDG